MPYTAETRSNAWPVRSIATMVFSKVGEAGSAAMRSISARFSAMAVSKAGFKSAGWKRPNGGTPPQGPDQGSSSAFMPAADPFSAEREEAASSGFAGCAAQPHKAARPAAIAAVRTEAKEIMFHPGRRVTRGSYL